MARSYANIITAIWRDEDFRSLTMAEQHAYLMLTTQADISAVGVLSLNYTRWAKRTKGMTAAKIRAAVESLAESDFVIVDDDTEEILVRSFVRWDKGYGNPNRQPSIRDAADEIESPRLRQALAREFMRLEVPQRCVPESFSQVEGHPDSHADSHPDSHPDSDRDESRSVVTKAREVETTLHTPQPASRSPRAQKRAARIPDDFTVTPEMVAWARERAPNIDGRLETEKFVNHWRAKSGRDATKLDWPATWRNWMLNARPSPNVVAIHRPSTTDQRVQAALDLAAKYAEEDAR